MAVQQADEAKNTRPPCGERRYDSNDDLCAQWKAADAAAEAASYAAPLYWLSVVGAVIGFLTAIFAGGAALFAKRAADAARAQLDGLERPFVFLSLSPDSGFTGPMTKAWVFKAQLVGTNFGRSPAIVREQTIMAEHIEIHQPSESPEGRAEYEAFKERRAPADPLEFDRDHLRWLAERKEEWLRSVSPDPGTSIIGGGDNLKLRSFDYAKQVTRKMAISRLSGAEPLFVTARVIYEGVLGQRWERFARWRYDLQGNAFIEDGGSEHNYERRLKR